MASSRDGIIWLASYPKSGNTWLRLLLANYFFGAPESPVGINDISRYITADISPLLYQGLCEKKGWDMAEAMNDIARRAAFMKEHIRTHGARFIKAHSCYYRKGRIPYYGPEYTTGVVYIVRDPRDVLCSYARHFRKTPPEAFEKMSDADNGISGDEQPKFEFLSSWDNHVNSFIGTGLPTVTVRYEDLKQDPAQVLGAIVHRIFQSADKDKLAFAVEHSSLERARGQEEKEGFQEAVYENQRFFGGGSGGWRKNLPAELARAAEERFGKTMKEFGYLKQ